MIVMGTRPEIIKLSEIIKKADQYFDLTLVHTGQNYDYELNKMFFEELGLREPDFYLEIAGENPGQTMGNAIFQATGIQAGRLSGRKQERQTDVLFIRTRITQPKIWK